ncbi:hypothetical protein Tco_0598889 [Tanacetum coccineum]
MMHKMKEGFRDGEVTLYPTRVFSVNNWALKPNQPEEPPFTTYMLAICSVDKQVVSKAPNPSSNVERVLQDTKPGAKPGHKKHSTSKQPPVSSSEVTKGRSSKAPTSSKTGHLKIKKESSLAMDSNPSQTSASTLVVPEMHKEDQQATSGPTSLGVTSEARANPHLSSSMSAFNLNEPNLNEPIYSTSFIIYSESASGNDASEVSIAEADPRNSALSDFVPQQQDQTKSVSEGLETVLTQPITGKGASSVAKQIKEETSSIIKLEDLAKLVSHVQPSFKDLDSPKDDHVIVMDDSDEDEEDEVHATKNSQKHKLELEKNKAEDALLKAKPFFPNLKDRPSKFNELTKEAKGLKQQVHELEIELPGDLKEIPSRLEEFTKTITNLTSQVVELKTLQWELLASLAKCHKIFEHVCSGSSKPEGGHIKKDKGKKAMSSKDAKEVSTENDFDDDTTHVPGSMVESSKKKELKRYCDKMLNRRAKSRITNRDILTRKGPITLKVYREDDTSEIIPEFKASDLHLVEWREVVTACPNKKGKGWTSIYKQIQERMDYLCTTEAELGIDLDRPISKQDPLDRLNDLENKKRKHANDIAK